MDTHSLTGPEMRETFVHPLRPTSGEKRLLAAGAGVGLCGGFAAFVIVTQMGQNKAMLRSLTDADLWFMVAGVLGAMTGLYAGRRWFGHEGPRGALKVVAGLLVVSFVGALVGGTLALPLYGTMFGPMMFTLTLAANPALSVLWVASLIGSHLLIRCWRRERALLPVLSSSAPMPDVPRRTARRNWLTSGPDRQRG